MSKYYCPKCGSYEVWSYPIVEYPRKNSTIWNCYKCDYQWLDRLPSEDRLNESTN